MAPAPTSAPGPTLDQSLNPAAVPQAVSGGQGSPAVQAAAPAAPPAPPAAAAVVAEASRPTASASTAGALSESLALRRLNASVA
jgi:hypothetical protein